jgi:hypothetical protein
MDRCLPAGTVNLHPALKDEMHRAGMRVRLSRNSAAIARKHEKG